MRNEIKNTKYIRILFVVALMVLVVTGVFKSAIRKEPKMEIFADNHYEETLKVVINQEFPPFSYKNKAGNMVGHDIEVLNAIANKMKVNVDIHSLPQNEAMRTMIEGNADVILGIEYNPKYIEKFDLTTPIEINQLVAFGIDEYSFVYELYDKRVAILRNGLVSETLIRPLAFKNVEVYGSYEEAFYAIQNGELDYLIGRYSVGNRVLAQENIEDVSAVGRVLSNNAFCIGVQKNNEELLNRMNDAISSITEDGTLNEISNKWLGNFSSSINWSPVNTIITIIFITVAIFSYMDGKHRKKLIYLLEKDALTGLPSRRKFGQNVRTVLQTAKPCEYMMVSLDINRFKNINKIYGIEVGDRVLCSLANILKEAFKKEEYICRLQNDNFLFFTQSKIELINSLESSDEIIEPIKESFESTIKKLDIDSPIYLGIGCYEIENPNESISYIIDCANTAKSSKKHIYGNSLSIYTKEMKQKQEKEQIIISSVKSAIENNEFFIVIQPKYELQTRKIIGGEVLVRWKKQDGSLVYPNDFIPLFEQNNFINTLDFYVLEKTCQLMKSISTELPVVSINVSVVTLLKKHFVENYSNVIKQYGIPFDKLEIELTESVLDSDYERVSQIIAELKNIGFKIAIDDFGKGASSLSRLKEIQADVIKVDKSLVDDIACSDKAKLVIESILTMTGGLGVISLAEGIENQEQAKILHQMGCDIGQGYYYDRPLSIEEFLLKVENDDNRVREIETKQYEMLREHWPDCDDLSYSVMIVRNNSFSTLVTANEAFYKLIGYTKEEFRAEHQNRISEIIIDNLYTLTKNYIETKRYQFGYNLRILTNDKGVRWIRNNVEYDQAGNIFYSTLTDITDSMLHICGENIAGEGYLLQSEFSRYLADCGSDYVYITDVETDRVVYANNNTLRFCGFNNLSDFGNKKYYEIVFGTKEPFMPEYYDNLTEEEFSHYEYYNKHLNMYSSMECKLISINMRKFRLHIISDVTSRRNFQNEISLQNTLKGCVEFLYNAATDNTVDASGAFTLMLQYLNKYFSASRAYYYGFSTLDSSQEYYEVLADGVSKGSHEVFKSTEPDKKIKLMKLLEEKGVFHYTTAQILDMVDASEDKKERLKAYYESYEIDSFIYGGINDKSGNVIGFIGIDNPTSNVGNTDLLRLLSHFIYAFIKKYEG